MRIYNYKKGAARRVAVQDDNSIGRRDRPRSGGCRDELAARDPRRARHHNRLHRIGGAGPAPGAQGRPPEPTRPGEGRRSLARARLFAPLEPAVILCSGENYWGPYRDEKSRVVEGKEPEFFIKLQQCTQRPL